MARLTQQQVEQWIAQNGGPQAVQYGVEQKSIRNPSTDPAEQALQPYINIEVEVWRAFDPRTGKPTGAELTVRRDPDKGDFEQIENKSAAPQPANQDAAPPGGKSYIDDGPEAGPSGRRWGWNPQTKAYDRDLGPSPAAQQPPKPTKSTSTKPVSTHPGYSEVTETDTVAGTSTTYYIDANGNRVNALPQASASTRKPVAGRPGIYEVTTVDPTTKQTETHYEDEAGARVPTPTEIGKETREAIRGKDGKPYTKVTKADPATGKGEVYYEDGQGNRVDPPDVKEPQVKLPPDAPQFDGTDGTTAFESYNRLFAYVNQKVMSGEWTAEQGKAILSGPHEQTKMLLDRQAEDRRSEEGLRRDQLTERSQDMTQTGNRLQFGQNAASTAIKTSGDLIKAAEGGESTIVPLMVLQAGMGQAMGGFRDAPNITLGSGLMPAVARRAGEGFAAPAAPDTVGAPMTPEQAAATVGPERAAEIRANPVFRPRSEPKQMSSFEWMTPTGPQAMVPSQILKSGTGMGSRTADDLERELLEEGYSPTEVREAKRRAMARAGIPVA